MASLRYTIPVRYTISVAEECCTQYTVRSTEYGVYRGRSILRIGILSTNRVRSTQSSGCKTKPPFSNHVAHAACGLDPSAPTGRTIRCLARIERAPSETAAKPRPLDRPNSTLFGRRFPLTHSHLSDPVGTVCGGDTYGQLSPLAVLFGPSGEFRGLCIHVRLVFHSFHFSSSFPRLVAAPLLPSHPPTVRLPSLPSGDRLLLYLGSCFFIFIFQGASFLATLSVPPTMLFSALLLLSSLHNVVAQGRHDGDLMSFVTVGVLHSPGLIPELTC